MYQREHSLLLKPLSKEKVNTQGGEGEICINCYNRKKQNKQQQQQNCSQQLPPGRGLETQTDTSQLSSLLA